MQMFVFSQSLINFRDKEISLEQDTIKLDSLSIVSQSLKLTDCEGNEMPLDSYEFDFEKSSIIFKNKPDCNNIKISYKVFPINYFEPKAIFKKEDFLISTKDDAFNYDFVFSPEDFITTKQNSNLSRKGSISRGVGFGNNQDVIVNSAMNLQLDGELSDNLFIQAAISDNNIPIQPDGNTQQLQEFDKIFIKIFNDRFSLTAGDFELSRPKGYFLNYSKKAQGAKINFNNDIETKSGKLLKINSQVSGAASKGKFNRQEIAGIEANQGPYKLVGANNEQFIVVLAGTERIYIDGKLLNRGFENDYVIDYNLGEIIFTTKQPINKDKRIIAEFEYSDRNYSRFLITGSTELTYEKSKFWLNFYDETDNKNQPFDQNINQQDRFMLSQIGDNLDMALIPGFDSLEFIASEIRYKLTDTIINGIIYDSIFVHSSNPELAHYRLSFAFVGENKGFYKKGVSAANGRVYEWVAPENGKLQGDYMPYRLIVTPKKSQLINAGGEIEIGEKTQINFEAAFSKYDINTFSKLDAHDDKGFALKSGIKQAFYKTEKTWFGAFADYMFLQKDFRAIENFRTTEFTRDWNLNEMYSQQNENNISGGILYSDKKLGTANFTSTYLDRALIYSGLRNLLNANLKLKSWSLIANASLLQNKDTLANAEFLRHNLQIKKDFKFLSIGIAESAESNIRNLLVNEDLSLNSFKFNSYQAFLNSPDSAKAQFRLDYKYREDFLPKNNELNLSSNSHDFNLGTSLLQNPNHKFKLDLNYRILEVKDSSLYIGNPENNMTGRAEYNFKLWKGAISSGNFYEISSGLERKTEFSYIEVAPGQGVYTWTDYNNNGIQELDEFEIAHFIDQANFIRIINPTAEYIKTYSNQISQNLNFNPSVLLKNKTGFLKFLSKFSNQTAYNISQKNTSAELLEYANPFAQNIDDEKLVNQSSSFRNSLSFNRGNPKIGADYILNSNNNKLLLVSGFDTRKILSHNLQIRYNISPKIGFQNKISQTDKNYNSEYFASKTYAINILNNEFQFNFQPNLNNRLSFKHIFKQKNNIGGEKLLANDFGLEYRLSSVKKGSLTANFNYIHYDYNSSTNGALAYEMLEGFMPGSNITWALTFQRQLANGLQISINYSARKSSDTKIIHNANLQLRAFF
jgi:hypothetical protein